MKPDTKPRIVLVKGIWVCRGDGWMAEGFKPCQALRHWLARDKTCVRVRR